ncbi:MAG: hypothetical protein QXJ14_02735 [Candidatus Aenigmatarchaeota archaeon]
MYENIYNINNLYSFFVVVNNLSSGLLGFLIIFGSMIIFFRAANSKFEMLSSLVFTFIFGALLTNILSILGLLDISFAVLISLISAIITAAAYIKLF